MTDGWMEQGLPSHLTQKRSFRRRSSQQSLGSVLKETKPNTTNNIKGKVFPYSLPRIGPGADPGVQAVSPQVT